MYNEIDRDECVAWVGRQLPRLLPTVAFFYSSQPRIWLAGGLVPVWKIYDADVIVRTVARLPGVEAPPLNAGAGVLCSCEGGIQGNGLSTAMCVGRHIEIICAVQRANPDVDITGIADDTYDSNGILKPVPALPDLVRDTDSETPTFLQQKALCMVTYCSEWLSWLDYLLQFPCLPPSYPPLMFEPGAAHTPRDQIS